jgi:hypothetical protein
MRHVYLDHNIVTRLAVERSAVHARREHEAVQRLLTDGDVRFVLSAVSLYEIAKSTIEMHVADSIDLLRELSPLWLSNPVYLPEERARAAHRWATSTSGTFAIQPDESHHGATLVDLAISSLLPITISKRPSNTSEPAGIDAHV